MFYSLKGLLVHIEPEFVVIDCGGVGYKCFVTMNTHKLLPSLNQGVMLYTLLNVREDSIDLFGFFSEQEMNCFKMLTSVSGVGAKVGLAILSVLYPEQVALAIASDDSKTLTLAQGVGNKLAQRIVLELKDKLKKVSLSSNNPSGLGVISASNNISQAIEALSVLGYSQNEVTPIVSKLDNNLPVEELIRLSLKTLAGGV